ncbi:hypothetical protein B0H11DRAFT_1919678 [Mycena galericulata]|nr:hypothetical protein B0H11DRAFT_1919678 [Mycena galericulata]
MSRKPGPKSKFTEEQEAHIASFYDELREKNNTSSTADVTTWKKDKINDIMKSPLFEGKLADKDEDPKNGTDHSGWSTRILKKFNSHVQNMKGAHIADTFFKFSPLTGFGLFGMEQRKSIPAAAQAEATGTEARVSDRLEIRQQEMWEALDSHARADYERRAKDIAPSVATQKPSRLSAGRCKSLERRLSRRTCRAYGALASVGVSRRRWGLAIWGVSLLVNGHAADNTPDMADETEDWEASIDRRWVHFAEKVIPRGQGAVSGDIDIPRNPSGIPVFPSLVLRRLTAEDLTQILERYLTELWSNTETQATRPGLRSPRTSPDAFSYAETFAIAEYFFLNAATDAKDPFIFRSGTADRELTPTERASSGTPDEDAGVAGKRKGETVPDNKGHEPQKKRKKAQAPKQPNDGRAGASAVASTASGPTTKRQTSHGRRASRPASVPLNHSGAKPMTEAPRRVQPKRERFEPQLQRPAPPSGTGRPGFDYVLEGPKGEFIGRQNETGSMPYFTDYSEFFVQWHDIEHTHGRATVNDRATTPITPTRLIQLGGHEIAYSSTLFSRLCGRTNPIQCLTLLIPVNFSSSGMGRATVDDRGNTPITLSGLIQTDISAQRFDRPTERRRWAPTLAAPTSPQRDIRTRTRQSTTAAPARPTLPETSTPASGGCRWSTAMHSETPAPVALDTPQPGVSGPRYFARPPRAPRHPMPAASTSNKPRDDYSDLSELSDLDDDPVPKLGGGPTPTPDDVLGGDVVRTRCDLQMLLPVYEQTRGDDAADDPAADLDAMHPRHLENARRGIPRRSTRLQDLLKKSPVGGKRKGEPLARGSAKKAKSGEYLSLQPPKAPIRDAQTLKFLDPDGSLKMPKHGWMEATISPASLPLHRRQRPPAQQRPRPPPTAIPAGGVPPKNHVSPGKESRKKRRGGVGQKNRDGSLNPLREEAMARRAFERGEVVQSHTFSLLHDASRSTAGWQGRAPPPIVRNRIRELYRSKPGAEALEPWLRHFIPIPYVMGDGEVKERGTSVVDKNGLVFFYRSFRAMWLIPLVEEIEAAQEILVGEELQSATVRAGCANRLRGPHLPIIIGHQRQSAVEPYLTAWHQKHAVQVERFLSLRVVKRIIKWVCSVVRAVWPGIAADMEEEAEWHFKKYGIRPLFGYFWNFCLNAAFPGQARVHTWPHADCKNQRRTWIVLWEAGFAAELPPWALAGYPSALFYHFNMDTHRLQHVWTEMDVMKPTPENSHPIVEGDDTGRGSMVFFSQSSMCHGPATGYGTLEWAVEAGHSGTTDYGSDINAAFQKALILRPVPQEIIDAIGDRPPKQSDFGL